jgi:hypothetical protein
MEKPSNSVSYEELSRNLNFHLDQTSLFTLYEDLSMFLYTSACNLQKIYQRKKYFKWTVQRKMKAIFYVMHTISVGFNSFTDNWTHWMTCV